MKDIVINKIIILVCVSTAFGVGSSIFFGVPIWFESPKTKCFSLETQSYYRC